jgi:hypothetical protein
MSRRPARCTEADLNRAIKAADRASVPRAVKIDPDGTIWIVPTKDALTAKPELEPKKDLVF